MNIALVGATGLVGQKMVQVLEEHRFPVSAFYPAASSRSLGKHIHLLGRDYPVCSLADAVASRPDVALFSAGAGVSREWAPKFAAQGTFVIDNSSAWRMDPNVPLVVPEVNGHVLNKDTRLIANPNCSTIQMVAALAPLHRKFRIKRIVIATYQSVTGTGVRAVRQLEQERAGIAGAEKVYPHQIDLNCFPHGGDFLDDGYTTEELKLLQETRKILEDDHIRVTATVVRIPVMGGHSEAVNVEFHEAFEIPEIVALLRATAGVVVQDDPSRNIYPTPLYANEKDEVFVGRIRRDNTVPNGLNLWIVSDNLRKGAATNAVQIARLLMQKGFLQ